eukprot:IDg5747t1
MNASPCFNAPLPLTRPPCAITTATTPHRRPPRATLPSEKRAFPCHSSQLDSEISRALPISKQHSEHVYMAHVQTASVRLLQLGLAFALVPEQDPGTTFGGHVSAFLTPFAYVAKQLLVVAAHAQLPPAGL